MPLVRRSIWPLWVLAATLAAAPPTAAQTTRAGAPSVSACAAAAERGQSLRDATHLLEAREQFLICSNPSCPPVVHADCSQWVSQLANDIPSLVVRVQTVDGHDVTMVRVFVDDVLRASQLDGKPMLLDPGPHAVRVESEQGGLEERVLVATGERNRPLVLRLPPPPPEPPASAPASPAPSSSFGSKKTVGYVLLGVGAAALASFTVLEIVGQHEYAQMRDGCAQTHSCSSDDIDSARTKFIGAGVSLGVSAVALGLGAWLLLSGSSDRTRPNALRALSLTF